MNSVSRARLAVLISGRGSNLVALAKACASGAVPAEIVVVLSNVEDATGLEAARSLGLPTEVVASRALARRVHERRVLALLEGVSAEWICLAGYMRLLSREFVAEYPERILNIHPSLLPAFPGLDAQRQAIDHGVRVSGCTVHLVDPGLDSGPIVLQRPVDVRDGDDADALGSRILEQEHQAYPAALKRLLTEPWKVVGRRLDFDVAGRGATPEFVHRES